MIAVVNVLRVVIGIGLNNRAECHGKKKFTMNLSRETIFKNKRKAKER